MIKVIDYDPSITRCDPPEKIRYDRTDFIADTEADITAMNSSNSKYLNYPAGSSVLCLGNGKWYLLNAECNEYLEFKEGGSSRTKANLHRSTLSENGSIYVTVNGETVDDGVNALNIGDTVTVTVTADSGYQVKTITLNGEEIENNSEFTVDGDITLIAEFEEAGEDVVWEDTLDFVSVEDMPGWIVFNGEEAFPELDKLNTTDTFSFSIPELNKSVMGKFTKVSEEDDAYILGEEEDGIVLQANTLFYAAVVESDVEGTYTVKLTKSGTPTPSGYTWNGIDTSEKDVELDGVYFHYVNTAPSEIAADYIGATLVYKLGDTETPYVLSEEDIEDMSEGEKVAIAISITDRDPVAMVFKNYGEFADGLYFLRDDEESSVAYGGYTTSLTLAE